MIVYNIILLATSLCFASSEEINDDIHVNVHRPKQLPTYLYNHPPLFELADDISVVHAKKVRQVKSIVTTTEHLEDNNRESLGSIESQRTIKRSVRSVPENNPDDNAQSVAPNPTENKIKRRKQRRRPQGSNKNSVQGSQVTKYNSTEINEITTTPKPTFLPVTPTAAFRRDVTVFPKRPIEDSKRIEFQKQARTRAPVVKILDAENFVYAHTGNFHYSYDTADGTKVSSRGELRTINNEGTGEAVVGSVSYKDNDGNDYNLSYTADENGYRPVGAHLPTPPPIPPAIARALQYLATKTDTITEAPKKKNKI